MNRRSGRNSVAFRVAATGIFAALTLTVSFIEKVVTAGLPLPPGVKPGLGNVAVMLVCFIFGLGYALGIVVVKAAFTLVVSGVSASVISLCGGLLSVLVMYLLRRLTGNRAGDVAVSVAGALAHNTGQMLAASALVGSFLYAAYAPVLLVSAVACGALTGVILKLVYPAVGRAVGRAAGRAEKEESPPDER